MFFKRAVLNKFTWRDVTRPLYYSLFLSPRKPRKYRTVFYLSVHENKQKKKYQVLFFSNKEINKVKCWPAKTRLRYRALCVWWLRCFCLQLPGMSSRWLLTSHWEKQLLETATVLSSTVIHSTEFGLPTGFQLITISKPSTLYCKYYTSEGTDCSEWSRLLLSGLSSLRSIVPLLSGWITK